MVLRFQSIGGYMFISLAALFWGISGTTAKAIFSDRIDPLIIVQTRVTFSFIVLFLILLISDRGALKIGMNILRKLSILGIIGIAGSNFTYYYSIYLTTVATAILLQYMSVILVMVYGIFFLGEDNAWYKWFALSMSLSGCFLAVDGLRGGTIEINKFGVLLGLLSAICFSFLTVYGKSVFKECRNWTALLYSFASAAVFWLFINPPHKIVHAGYDFHDWTVFFGFSIMSVLVPYFCYFMGLRLLQAGRAIIVSTLEPVIAIVTAFLFLGESMNIVQGLGAVLVLAAIILLQTHPVRSSGLNASNAELAEGTAGGSE